MAIRAEPYGPVDLRTIAITDADFTRIAIIAIVAIGAHIAVVFVRILSQWLIGTGFGSIAKARTITRFTASTAVFIIWFVAIGYLLHELGVRLEAYLASATIIGLAVSFGSQSLVQDVIGGLTLIFGGLLDVGDMVDIAGQTGVVEKIGIRYTELRNVQGAIISIPNRNVANVIRFPIGYIRAFVDVRLPQEESARAEATSHIERIANSAYHQFTGIMIRPPSVQPMSEPTPEHLAPADSPAVEQHRANRPHADRHSLRIKFRIWPGQGNVVETTIRQRIIGRLRRLDPNYQDWMVAVHFRVEPAFKRRAVSALEAFRRRRSSERSTN